MYYHCQPIGHWILACHLVQQPCLFLAMPTSSSSVIPLVISLGLLSLAGEEGLLIACTMVFATALANKSVHSLGALTLTMSGCYRICNFSSTRASSNGGPPRRRQR